MKPENEGSPKHPLALLHFANRAEWRRWLAENHAKAKEVWVGHWKVSTGKPTVDYDEAVEEALCFGWVDGKKKSVDAERYAYRYTPRSSNSLWSALNIDRAKRLIAEGKMTPSGLAAFKGHAKRRSAVLPVVLPRELEKLFRKSTTAWKNFEEFSPGYKKLCIGWVASARKAETQLRRLDTLIQHSAKNTKIKFM
jgi:uncharacterized protein YdeI (YjbR/CyaY-like superfamily)